MKELEKQIKCDRNKQNYYYNDEVDEIHLISRYILHIPLDNHLLRY